MMLGQAAEYEKLKNPLASGDLSSAAGRQAVFRELAEASGWTPDEIAQRLKIHRTYPYGILSGTKIPGRRLLEAFSEEVRSHLEKSKDAIPVETAKQIHPEAAKNLRTVAEEIAKLPVNSQVLATSELSNVCASILRVIRNTTGALMIGIANSLPGMGLNSAQAMTKKEITANTSHDMQEEYYVIPSDPHYFESLRFGYFVDFDPTTNRLKFFEESLKLKYAKMFKRRMEFEGEAKSPSLKGSEVFHLLAHRVTNNVFQFSAQAESGPGFGAVFNLCIDGILSGIWTGKSNDLRKSIYQRIFLSPERCEESQLERFLPPGLTVVTE